MFRNVGTSNSDAGESAKRKNTTLCLSYYAERFSAVMPPSGVREEYFSYEGRTESHEQLFFLHANWEEQKKESAVMDGTSCCVILECLVTSIACIT